MKSKQRKVRLAISGVLLAAVVATGIYAYNQDHAREEQARQEEEARLSEEQEQLSQDVNTSNAGRGYAGGDSSGRTGGST